MRLRANELSALDCLAQHGPLTLGELGDELVLTSGGITALVRRLEHLGHITRRPHPTDGRSSVVAANPETLEAIATFSAPLIAELDAELSRMRSDQTDGLIGFLMRVVEATEGQADRLIYGDDIPAPAAHTPTVEAGVWI